MHEPVQTPADAVDVAPAGQPPSDAPGGTFAYQSLMPGVMLGVVALLASGALAVSARMTAGPIAEAEALDLRQSLAEVLPEGFADNDFLNDTARIDRDGTPVTIYRARKGGAVDGVMFGVAENGYSSLVQLIMAVDTEGRILGVRVLKHAETPGLGDKVEITKSKWIRQFDGRSLENPTPARWQVKKDGGEFDQLTGATITPRAVVKAVKGGLMFFEAHRQQILGEAQ